MARRYWHHAALSLVIAAAMSCGGGSSGTAPDTVPRSTVTATVDGTAFTASSKNDQITWSYSNGSFLLIALDTQGRQIELHIGGVFAPQSVDLSAHLSNIEYLFQSQHSWNTGIIGSVGNVTFSTVGSSNTVGTFTGTLEAATSTGASGTRTVANGKFSLVTP